MVITLSNGTTTLTLDEDLIWIDELDWNPVASKQTRSIGGASLFDTGVKVDGRPITLRGDEDSGWLQRSLVVTLVAWASIPNAVFTLTLGVTAYSVSFDQTQQAVESRPLVEFSAYDPTDYYIATLRFLQRAS